MSESLVAAINRLKEQYIPELEPDSDSSQVPYHQQFSISVSMCPNACSRPQISDFGIIGAVVPGVSDEPCTGCGKCTRSCREKVITVTDHKVTILENCLMCGSCIAQCQSGSLISKQEGFRVQLGGKLGRHPRLADELPRVYIVEEIVELTDLSLRFYFDNKKQNVRFGDLISESHFSWLPDSFSMKKVT